MINDDIDTESLRYGRSANDGRLIAAFAKFYDAPDYAFFYERGDVIESYVLAIFRDETPTDIVDLMRN